ncbi:hypothetical protein BU23DRAFT_45653 [Bimuria novae-zelandiae CBS 107.79]|uniref:Secreted protein n=1 Tax=Bimuria novae-zelandiae CBS 107.79 TaxID=1447943 RepID=A0A6A5VFN2_9PLEO|nr:hypothetical protein BU23DRAFT_45653 [Bimuria novae-zelandiae CBS 107.79]
MVQTWVQANAALLFVQIHLSTQHDCARSTMKRNAGRKRVRGRTNQKKSSFHYNTFREACEIRLQFVKVLLDARGDCGVRGQTFECNYAEHLTNWGSSF